MIETVAILIVVLVFLLFLSLQKGQQAASEKAKAQDLFFEEFMRSQGFETMDRFDPCLQPIIKSLKVSSHSVYVEHALRNPTQEDELLCRLRTSPRGSNRNSYSMVSTIHRRGLQGDWILLTLPENPGFASTLVQKAFQISVSRAGFSRTQLSGHCAGNSQIEIYVKGTAQTPDLDTGLRGALTQAGNVILRTAGPMIVIERVSALNRSESLEAEATALLKISRELKPFFQD